MGATASELQMRPRAIFYTGDGSGFLAGREKRSGGGESSLRWQVWTARHAVAQGADWINNCRPTCAAGTEKEYPATIRLSRLRRQGGVLVFTRLSVSYKRIHPSAHGSHWSDKSYYSQRKYFWKSPR
jgi:hypothetical protein